MLLNSSWEASAYYDFTMTLTAKKLDTYTARFFFNIYPLCNNERRAGIRPECLEELQTGKRLP